MFSWKKHLHLVNQTTWGVYICESYLVYAACTSLPLNLYFQYRHYRALCRVRLERSIPWPLFARQTKSVVADDKASNSRTEHNTRKTCCHCFETTWTLDDEAISMHHRSNTKLVYFFKRKNHFVWNPGFTITGFIYELYSLRYRAQSTPVRHARVPRRLNVLPDRDSAMALEREHCVVGGRTTAKLQERTLLHFLSRIWNNK